MTISQFKKIVKQIKLVESELEQEAIENGIDLMSQEYEDALIKAKQLVLEKSGFTYEEYKEIKERISSVSKAGTLDFVDRTKAKLKELEDRHIPTLEEINEIVKSLIPKIPAPQIINKIVKVKEKPITKVVKEKTIVKELDRTELKKIGQDVRTLQLDHTDLVSKVGQIKMPDDYVRTSVLEPSVKEIVAPELNRILRSLQSQIYRVSQDIKQFESSENLFDRTGTVITSHNAGDSLRVDGGLGVGTAPNQFYGLQTQLSNSDAIGEIYGIYNTLSISGAGGGAYGVWNDLTSADDQVIIGNWTEMTFGSANSNGYGDYIISNNDVINDPTYKIVGIWVDWRIQGTDSNNAKWAFYNNSATLAGKIFLGKDNVKTYWGTGYDASAYYDGTNFVINPKEAGTGYFGVLGNENIYWNNDGGDVSLTIQNTASEGSTDETASLIFRTAGGYKMGKIVAGRAYDYTAADQDSFMDFYTATGDTDTLALRIDNAQSFNFQANSLTTTGLITTGNLQVDNININGAVISSNTGAISFSNENLTTTGDIYIKADSKYLYFGAGDDARINFSGTQFQIRSDVVTATDSLLLRGGTNGIAFNIGATEQIILTDGKLAPTTNNDIDLGDDTHRFKDLYLVGSTIHMGTSGDEGTLTYTTATNTWTLGDSQSLSVSGALSIGASLSTYPFEIRGGTNLLQMRYSTNGDDNSSQYGGFVVRHYDIDEEDLVALVGASTSTQGILNWGGGSSNFNAATKHIFYTGATNTTTGGTSRYEIDSSGNHDFKAGNMTTTGIATLGTIYFGSDTGVSATAASGVLTLQGRGPGYDEDLTIDFDSTTNTVKLGSNTGVTHIGIMSPIYYISYDNGAQWSKYGLYWPLSMYIQQYNATAGYKYPFRSIANTTMVDNALVLNSGKVGINWNDTTAPDRHLEINTGAETGGIRISYNSPTGSSANYGEILVDSSGNMTFSATGVVGFTGDIAPDYISTDGNEFLAHDVLEHTITSDDEGAHAFSDNWDKSTQDKIVSMTCVVEHAGTPDIVYAGSYAPYDLESLYNGTVITVQDFGTSWIEGDIVRVHIVYEKPDA